ncbi:MAG: hypothetical protein ACM3Q4_14875 [Acidobacteriota bacterium]
MRKLILLVSFIAVAALGADAQPAKKGTEAVYPQFSLWALSPQHSMLLGARMEKGKKEQFGVLLGASKSATVEFLDASGSVIKSAVIADLGGKASGAKLLRAMSDGAGSHSEAVYEVPMPQGKAELVVRALTAELQQNAKAKIILSFALKGGDRVAGVRMALPVEGQASAQENGFVVASKGPAAFSAAVFPKAKSVTAEKNIVTVNVPVLPSQNAAEKPLVWMVVEGASSANEASAQLKKNAQYAADPNLVIVTTADRMSTQPNDTVTYTLVCTNIGLGDATDVVLSNPIPAGTTYLEGSAEGEGTAIGVDREKAAAPQLGAAKTISWKLNEALKPGAEKNVSFKIIVR